MSGLFRHELTAVWKDLFSNMFKQVEAIKMNCKHEKVYKTLNNDSWSIVGTCSDCRGIVIADFREYRFDSVEHSKDRSVEVYKLRKHESDK